MVIICGGIWYFVQSAEDKVPVNDDITVTKIASSSAKPKTTTSSATPSDWKTYDNTYNGQKFSFKYPKEWQVNVEVVDKEANNINYIATNGTFNVSFWNSRGRGSNISGPGEVLAQNYTTKSVTVKFYGKDEAAGEKIAKDGKSWEIFPVAMQNSFSYDLYSTTLSPSDAERSLMLKIVSTFKFL